MNIDTKCVEKVVEKSHVECILEKERVKSRENKAEFVKLE